MTALVRAPWWIPACDLVRGPRIARITEPTDQEVNVPIVYLLALTAVKASGLSTPFPKVIHRFDVPSSGSPSGGWTITANLTDGDGPAGLPRYHVAVDWHGFPAGIVGPGAGLLAAGAAANERTLEADLIAYCRERGEDVSFAERPSGA